MTDTPLSILLDAIASSSYNLSADFVPLIDAAERAVYMEKQERIDQGRSPEAMNVYLTFFRGWRVHNNIDGNDLKYRVQQHAMDATTVNPMGKINLIKSYRALTKANLVDSKEWVEANFTF